jgi:glycosyltransferase involved in cell wall biosynthesis
MSQPLVSIIMPAYNAEKFIAESIESVLAQTYTNWELLVVDDGSTDNTKQIVEKFCAADHRVKYFYQPNGKQGKARNNGLTHATGKYIAFLDSDDVWLPQKLETQLKEIEEKNVDLVFAECIMFTGSVSESKKLMHSGKGYFKGDEGLHKFLDHNQVPCSTVLVKKYVLQDAGGFTENKAIPYAEDYHLWLRLLLQGFTFYGIETELAGYRLHPASSSHGDKLVISHVIEAFQDIKNHYRSYKSLLNAYQKKWFGEYYYSTNNWKQKAFNELVSKNCRYLQRSYLIGVFKTLTFLGGINFTRKVINISVNGYNKKKLRPKI